MEASHVFAMEPRPDECVGGSFSTWFFRSAQQKPQVVANTVEIGARKRMNVEGRQNESRVTTTTTSSASTWEPRKISQDPKQDARRPPTEPTATVASRQTALIVTPDLSYSLVDDFLAPRDLAPTEVMIRNKAVGLNHIDWKSVEHRFCLPTLPWVTGREMAGVVEQVGARVERVRKGDRVWTSTYYRDRRAGCFQDLVVVPQHTVFPIPSCLDFHTAAALGVAGLTAAMTLWKWLRVPIPTPMQRPRQSTVATTTVLASNPPEEGRQVMLVWGGSTATGQFAVQLATRAGFEVIAVCSEATAPLVRSLGAAHVVTYTHRTDTQVIDEILHLAGNRLTKAVDLVGSTTTEMVLRVIASSSGRVDEVDFAPLACMSKGTIVPTNVKVHTVEMKQFVLDQTCAIYGERLNQLIEDGLVRTPPISVLKGGLGAVEGGLRRVKEGNLEGRKLVVSLCP